MFCFETEQWLPFPREEVFAFFANPQNLPPLMPGWQRARIKRAHFEPPPSRPAGVPVYPGIAAGDGTLLTLTARALPLVPLRGKWIARIEAFRWNEGFCDVQIEGPFRYWRHCHSVRTAAGPKEGDPKGAVVHDQVHYELPLPAGAALVNTLIVAPQMRSIFHFRQAKALFLLQKSAEFR